MNVIDTSVLIAILTKEGKYLELVDSLSVTKSLVISTATYLEAAIVIFNRQGINGLQKLEEQLKNFSIEIIDFDKEQAHQAIIAYQRYGRGHKAKLNFGDCFSYALAKVLDANLLYKGNDFSKTDLG